MRRSKRLRRHQKRLAAYRRRMERAEAQDLHARIPASERWIRAALAHIRREEARAGMPLAAGLPNSHYAKGELKRIVAVGQQSGGTADAAMMRGILWRRLSAELVLGEGEYPVSTSNHRFYYRGRWRGSERHGDVALRVSAKEVVGLHISGDGQLLWIPASHRGRRVGNRRIVEGKRFFWDSRSKAVIEEPTWVCWTAGGNLMNADYSAGAERARESREAAEKMERQSERDLARDAAMLRRVVGRQLSAELTIGERDLARMGACESGLRLARVRSQLPEGWRVSASEAIAALAERRIPPAHRWWLARAIARKIAGGSNLVLLRERIEGGEGAVRRIRARIRRAIAMDGQG